MVLIPKGDILFFMHRFSHRQKEQFTIKSVNLQHSTGMYQNPNRFAQIARKGTPEYYVDEKTTRPFKHLPCRTC